MEPSRNGEIGKFAIRQRILLFTACATLLPSLLLGWVAYFKTHQLQVDSTEQQLLRVANYAASSLEGVLQQRLDEIGIYANTAVVKRALEEQSSTGLAGRTAQSVSTEPDDLLGSYLELLRSEAGNYQRLLAVDTSGQLIAQAPPSDAGTDEPIEGLQAPTRPGLVLLPGQPGSGRDASFTAVAPISAGSGDRLGFLVGVIPLSQFGSSLRLSPPIGVVRLSLVNEQGELLVNGSTIDGLGATPSPQSHLSELLRDPGKIAVYQDRSGRKIAGMAVPVGGYPVGLVVETDYAAAFVEIDRLRDISLMIVLLLLLGFGLSSFLVSRGILKPLNQLTTAAAEVASGNLEVRLEHHRRDELGFATKVFNDMVARLAVNRRELERLTITDSLTGLFSRNHIAAVLHQQIQRHQRGGPAFSVLMADLDHFKRINDRFGHLGGDAALQRVGKCLLELLRSIDSAARYGGEEFLIILEQTELQKACLTAERIRAAVESIELRLDGVPVPLTISIGVAAFSRKRKMSVDEIIRAADDQLYRAKASGRNCVMPPKAIELATFGGTSTKGT